MANVRATVAREAEGPLAAVVVVHENRGLNPLLETSPVVWPRQDLLRSARRP